jgi:hypothetical protein
MDMKRLFYILFLFVMVSCAANRVVADIGMSEEHFVRINRSASLVEMFENVRVYRVIHVYQPDKYVYFEKGLLVRMDEGQMMFSRWNPYVMPPEAY